MAVGGHTNQEFQPKFPVGVVQSLLPVAAPSGPACMEFLPRELGRMCSHASQLQFQVLHTHTHTGLNSIYSHLIPLNSRSPPPGMGLSGCTFQPLRQRLEFCILVGLSQRGIIHTRHNLYSLLKSSECESGPALTANSVPLFSCFQPLDGGILLGTAPKILQGLPGQG